MVVFYPCRYFLYSISHPNKHGEPTFDLTSDSAASVDNSAHPTECHLKLHRVLKKCFQNMACIVWLQKVCVVFLSVNSGVWVKSCVKQDQLKEVK